MRTGLKYAAGLIALYLAVYYATGAGQIVQQGSTGGVNLVKAFQGR